MARRPAIFHAGRRETPGGHDLLRILFVGVPSFRKGLDIMLRAFEAAFRPGEPVELLLKLAHYPDEQSRPYLYREWRTHAAALADRGYRIRAITHFYSEEEMAELYRSVDLICQPLRGEAFCIPLLEAMACGTPVIATAWGGPLDFVDERAGLLISDYKLIPEAALFTWSNDPRGIAGPARPGSGSRGASPGCLRSGVPRPLGRRRQAAGSEIHLGGLGPAICRRDDPRRTGLARQGLNLDRTA